MSDQITPAKLSRMMISSSAERGGLDLDYWLQDQLKGKTLVLEGKMFSKKYPITVSNAGFAGFLFIGKTRSGETIRAYVR